MTWYITAFTNDRARLIVSETRTDNEAIKNFAVRHFEKECLPYTVRTED